MTTTFDAYNVPNSMVEDHNKCERRGIYKHIFNRTSKFPSKPLQIGIEGHNVIAAYYENRAKGMDFTEAALDAMDVLDNARYLDGGVHGLLNSLLMSYLKTYKDAPWRVLAIEEKYSYQMPDPWYNFTLRLDLLVEMTGGPRKGQVGIVDWKFTNDFWSPWRLRMYQQLPKYLYVLDKMGIKPQFGIVAQIRYRSNAVEKFRHEIIERDPILEEEFMVEHNKTAARILYLQTLPVADALKVSRRALNYENCNYCPFQEPCKAGLEKNGKEGRLLQDNYRVDDYGYNHVTTG